MASCDDDFGLLGDDAHPAPPLQPPTAQQPAPPLCFADVAAAAGAGAGPFEPSKEESNHHAERGEAAHHAKRGRERAEELSSDGGEYCSYINSGGRGKKSRGGGGGSRGASDYRKDREEWTDGAIGSLLDAYAERFEQLNRGNLRGRDWEDVAGAVTDGQGNARSAGKSVEQCKNKIDNLKKRYKVESQRLAGSGSGGVSHWPWFKKMEQIVGNSASPATSKTLSAADDDKTRQPQQHGNRRYPLSSTGPPIAVGVSRATPLSSPRWKRVLLKIGGTALAGAVPQNVDPKVIMLIAREVQVACHHGVQLAIVVGGRNIFCEDDWVAATGTDRASTNPIGMMASVMNSVLLQASLEKIGVETRVQTALMMQEVAEPYVRRRAIRHLEKGRVVIFGGIGAGIGNPLFTTDTAAALRASESMLLHPLPDLFLFILMTCPMYLHIQLPISTALICFLLKLQPIWRENLTRCTFQPVNADVVLKGIVGDDEYSCPPKSNSNAPFEHISFRELAARGFSRMDMTAVTCCEENNIPVVIFNMLEPGNISRVICGNQIGTLVDQSGRIT